MAVAVTVLFTNHFTVLFTTHLTNHYCSQTNRRKNMIMKPIWLNVLANIKTANIKILALIAITTVSFYPLVACSESMENNLIEVKNFQHVAQLMRQKNLPLLLEFHAESCSYCRLLEEDFLNPMTTSPEYIDKIIVRQLQIDLDDEVIDFQGNKVTAGQFARRYNAFMTPTMVFLDANGREVAEKIIGINTPSLFSAYIDIEIEKALTEVRAKISLARRELLQKGLK